MDSIANKKEVKIDQSIRIVDGEFTPEEANDIVRALVNEKINFHKLQRLAIWEGDVNANASFPNSRIEELEREKIKFNEFVKLARKGGSMLRIEGDLKVSLIR